ncbi:MAG: MurR/RpiR family transcriptional regulator [Atopobiaceae bacterium]|nr:MurR/RpiR family transcriptional regulator [Atopobiaceae bacterium]
MSLIEQLKAKHAFTPTEQAIADFILHHAEDVPRMTVGELGEVAHVSKAAVIRLCHKLGLDGYRELRVELASELERRRSHLTNIDVDQPFTQHDSCATVMHTMAELEREAVTACYQSLSPDAIERVAQMVAGARCVVLYSVGDSCLVTSLFASKLTKLGIHCVSAGLYGDYAANTAIVGPYDIALFVTYSGLLLKGIMKETGIATVAKRGCKTVAITGLDADNPLVRDADEVISFQRRESQMGAIGSFYSTTCMNFVLNCIYARVYAYDFAGYADSKALADGLNRKSLFG